MTFTTSFILYHAIDEYSREMFYFNYYDGKIVLNEYELQKRESTRHKHKAVNPMQNTYKRHNRRDYPKTRASIIIPESIVKAALDYIRNQIRMDD